MRIKKGLVTNLKGKALKKEKTKIKDLKKKLDKRKRALGQVKRDWQKRHHEALMEKKEHVEVVDSADNSTPQLKAKSDPKPAN